MIDRPTSEELRDRIQREQLGLMQAAKPPETDGNVARWKNFFDRWHEEFPQLPVLMQRVLPVVERAFLRLMDEMGRTLTDEDSGAIDNDFALWRAYDTTAWPTELFFDRHGRLRKVIVGDLQDSDVRATVESSRTSSCRRSWESR